MATKWVAVAAVLLLCVALAECSIYRTTITETINDSNDRQSECRREMRQHQLGACRMYMRQGSPELLLRSSSGNQGSQPYSCCNQLRNVKQECRCEVLRQMAMEEGSRTGYGGREEDEAMRRAEKLADACGVRRCSMLGRSY